jgi:NAD(P)-dependent dehydrogenase (short-subunit alcohol dehydrogenase family)
MAAWVESCARLQPIDLVVANAGISAGTGMGSESAEQSREIFAVNLDGVLNTVRPAVAVMLQQKRGQIAIMSSLAGFRGFAGAPSYCASKAAVRMYGESLRGELAPHGIAVNVICPGFIQTPMTDANRFPMPFIMSAARAAAIMQKGLAANRARIAFPLPLYVLIRLIGLVPQDWINRPMARLPRKGSKS